MLPVDVTSDLKAKDRTFCVQVDEYPSLHAVLLEVAGS
jgi:hypothetical protein